MQPQWHHRTSNLPPHLLAGRFQESTVVPTKVGRAGLNTCKPGCTKARRLPCKGGVQRRWHATQIVCSASTKRWHCQPPGKQRATWMKEGSTTHHPVQWLLHACLQSARTKAVEVFQAAALQARTSTFLLSHPIKSYPWHASWSMLELVPACLECSSLPQCATCSFTSCPTDHSRSRCILHSVTH